MTLAAEALSTLLQLAQLDLHMFQVCVGWGGGSDGLQTAMDDNVHGIVLDSGRDGWQDGPASDVTVYWTPVCRLCGRYLAILGRPIRITVPSVTVAPTALVGSLIRLSNLPHSLQRGVPALGLGY